MISSKDRSYWIGASDTKYVMGDWTGDVFYNWMLEKMGLRTNNFSSVALAAGTHWEHKILDYVGAKRKDHQILIPELRLRVNLDGDSDTHIYEVKTFRHEKGFEIYRAYWQQVQVQMYAKRMETGREDITAEISAYGLIEDDYMNYFREIDPDRISRHFIKYDDVFIGWYLKRVKRLCEHLNKGEFPNRKEEQIKKLYLLKGRR